MTEKFHSMLYTHRDENGNWYVSLNHDASPNEWIPLSSKEDNFDQLSKRIDETRERVEEEAPHSRQKYDYRGQHEGSVTKIKKR